MGLDFYLRIPTDPNYDATQLEIEDDIVNFVQYIEMILTTNKGEVFGDPAFGASLESYLWNTSVSSGMIESEINRQIFEYCPEYCSKIPFSCEISFYKGDIYDTMLVDITVDGKAVLGIAATPQNANLPNSFL